MLKRFRFVLSLLLIFSFSTTLFAAESKDAYFPHVQGKLLGLRRSGWQ